MNRKMLTIAIASMATLVPLAQAQGITASPQKHPGTHRKAKKKATPSLAEEVRAMRAGLQEQIDQLKTSLAVKDAQISALERRSQNAEQAVNSANEQSQATSVQVQAINATVQQNTIAATGVESSVSDLKLQNTTVAENVQQIKQTTEKIQKSVDEPVALHYKGVTVIPGGFLAAEAIRRSHALNADIYTPFNAIPYPGADQAHLSEFFPTARQSRLSALVSGKVPFGTLNGYVEGDFLSAGSSSNNLQTNSYPLRLRQAWGQVVVGKVKFTAGQMYTLFTEDKKSTDPGQEQVPLSFDNNFNVGFTWLRQTGFRLQDSFTPKVTLAVSLENSQYQFSASNPSANFFFGNAGAAPGLNNPDASYTDQAAPDVLTKIALDSSHGHFEIGGIARFFRGRYYPSLPTSANAQNNTKVGGGFVASARYSFMQKVDVGVHVTAGEGTGRYGASLLPDITVHPDGTLALIHNAQGLFTLELHPTKKLDLFTYGGTEYAQRTVYRNAAGTMVGYAPQTGSNTGCFTEGVPTSGTGYTPSPGACLGATRDVLEGTVGYAYRIYAGPGGKVQYGLQYSYISREGWTGLGGAPKAVENQFYTSFRYYIP